MITLGANDASYGFGRFRNRIELFDIIPGTRQFTIPDGWKKIRVAVVGPGGGGQKSISSTYKYGGGGGGGGYAEKELDVVAGQVFTYTVGAGGSVNVPAGITSFGALLSATGGDTGTNNADQLSLGGAGGIGIGGTVNHSGGRGGVGGDSTKFYGGGGGASGNRFGSGGDGMDGALGGFGGSWGDYPRPLLYDDGWGLGITPYDLPLDGELVKSSSSSGLYVSVFSRVGQGTGNAKHFANLGGGACCPRDGSSPKGGIGGGGGGGDTSSGVGGPGCVIVEVLA